METVYDTLVTVLTDKFEVTGDRIGPDVSLTDLELDSLAVVELYVTLQEHWQVQLDEDDSAADMTLRQFAAAVAAQLTEPGPAR
ncbi:acyl carrier protein [Streptomyces chattanoogensis]|uniref:Acyl carrier protein n=1 Tax=Streptomyces chattanoogensis TaxID=66876 RepID=A0A0N0H3J0_9ACTN|nr:phosphopantetheine-binding protein [Streptomyces chattanoogensis]KPC66292.1 acyl carrier protein [Streptomyces chattanoogensis]